MFILVTETGEWNAESKEYEFTPDRPVYFNPKYIMWFEFCFSADIPNKVVAVQFGAEHYDEAFRTYRKRDIAYFLRLADGDADEG